jgi:hypothetical protein
LNPIDLAGFLYDGPDIGTAYLLTGDRVKDAEEGGVVHAPLTIPDLASSPVYRAATDSPPNFIEGYQALAFFQEDKGL